MNTVLGIMKDIVETMASINLLPDDLKICSKKYPFLFLFRESILQLVHDIMTNSKDETWIKALFNSNSNNVSVSTTEPVSRKISFSGDNIVVSESYLNIKNDSITKNKTLNNMQSDSSIEPIALVRSQSAQSYQSSSNQVPSPQNISKHNTLLRFILYPRSRDAALTLISTIMKQCVHIISRSTDDISLKLENRYAKSLIHEFIRGYISIMRYSCIQLEYYEGFLSMIAVLSNLRSFVADDSLSITKLYQHLYLTYTPNISSSKHVWKRLYPCIYTDLYECLNEIINLSSFKSYWSKEMRSHLLYHALYFVKYLLRNNTEGKVKFYKLLFLKNKNKLFYHDFINLIINLELHDTSFGTICIFLEILFEHDIDIDRLYNDQLSAATNLLSRVSKFSKLSVVPNGLFSTSNRYVPTFSNLSILPILFELMKYCSESLQLSILSTYKQSMELSKVNFYKCVHMEEPSMIELILDLMKYILHQQDFSIRVFTILGGILRDIGSHMINVSQLKRIYLMMNIKNISNRKFMIYVLINSLIGMINENRFGPTSFILCHGEESGLILPRIDNWPPNKGYSISIWFSINNSIDRIIKLPNDVTNEVYFKNDYDESNDKVKHPTILSMRNMNGSGVEIYLDHKSGDDVTNYFNTLIIKIYTSNLKENSFVQYDLIDSSHNDDVWHHLAISHIPAFFKKSSDIIVNIDGKIKKHTLPYPKNSAIFEPLIGNSSFMEKNISKSFYGKFGPIYFFSEPLIDAQLLSIYQLGPDYNDIFNIKVNNIVESVETVKVFDGNLTSLISLAYNPGIFLDRYILDITPEKNMFKWNDKIENSNALRRNFTYKFSTRKMINAFDCLGGSKILLYLLADIDNISNKDNEIDLSLYDQNAESTISLFNKILILFFKTLHNSTINFKFIKDFGFSTLSIILENISPSNLDDLTLNIFLYNLNGDIWSNEWKQIFIKDVILNFRLWIQTSYNLIRRILLWIREFIEKQQQNEAIFNLMPIHKWLDIIHNYFNEKKATDKMINEFEDRTISTSTLVTNITSHDMIDLRSLLYQIVYIQLCINSSYFDIVVNQLVSYSLIITSNIQIIENLLFLLRLLSVEKLQFVHILISTPSTYVCLRSLTSLFRHDHFKVRLYSIISFYSIIQLTCEFGKLPVNLKFLGDKVDDDKDKLSHKYGIIDDIVNQYTLDVSNILMSQNQDSNFNPNVLPYKTLLYKIKDFDSFSIIGFPVTTSLDVFVSLINEVLNKISISNYDNNFVQAQNEIIFQILHLTMHGLSCKRFIDDIEKLDYYIIDSTKLVRQMSMFSNENPSEKNILRKYSYIGNYTGTMRISISILFPSLLSIIRRTDIVDSSTRKRFLLDIKSSLQSFNNIECVISLPNWQNYFLDVLVSEQSVMDTLTERLFNTKGWNGDIENPIFEIDLYDVRSDNDLVTLKECKSITEIVIHTISTMHLHAFRYGNPPREYHVFKPEELNEVTYSKMNMKDLFELYQKGNRRIGAEVLRETISSLRLYGEREQSAFNARLLGLELLQLTMVALQQENETLNNSVGDSLDVRIIRRKLFELNLWIITFIILEYITIPPIQQARSMKHSTPVISKQNRKSFNFSDNDILSTSRSTISPRSSDGSVASQLFKKIDDVEDIDKLLNYNEDEFDNKVQFLDSRTMSSDNIVTSNDKAISKNLFAENSKQITTESKSQVLFSNDYSDFSNFHYKLSIDNTDYYNSVWNLVDSLFNILGPMDESPAWVSTNILDRMKLAMSVGFFLGFSVVNQMNESVESIVQTTDDSKNSLSSANIIIRDMPINKAIAGVFWIMLRVLLNLYLQGSQTTIPDNEFSPHVLALKKLASQLEELKGKSKDYYNSECLYVLGRIFKSLFKSNQSFNSAWFKEGLKFAMTLLYQQSNYLISRLLIIKDLENMKKSDLKREISSDFEMKSQTKLYRLLTKDFLNIPYHKKFSNKEILIDESNELFYKFEKFIGNDSYSHAEDIILHSITFTLSIIPDDNFSWNDWNEAIDPILEESQRVEDELMSSRLNDKSFLKPFVKSESSASPYLVIQTINDFVNKQNISITKYMKYQVKINEIKKRKILTKWIKLLEEIATERGPWGEGLNNSSEVFWAIDSSEDNLRMRLKTRPNPYGNRHESSSILAQSGSLSPDSTKVKSLAQSGDQSSVQLLRSNSYTQLLEKNVRRNSKVNMTFDPAKNSSKQRTDNSNAFAVEDDINDSNSSYSDVLSEEFDNEEDALFNTSKQVQDKVIFSRPCEIITPSTNSSSHKAIGLIELTKSKILFTRNDMTISTNADTQRQRTISSSPKTLSISVTNESQLAYQLFPNSQWETNDIINIQSRFYLLRMIAVEIFFTTRVSIFIKFSDKYSSNQFLQIIRKKIRPPLLGTYLGSSPEAILQSTVISSGQQLTLAWQNREISNFEYIMKLNTIAGRSYNDLGQYPIFPWILNDYTSATIDLKDSKIYRDLNWPIGAQYQSQRDLVSSKYNEVLTFNQTMNYLGSDDQSQIQPFHFGTHYSVAGFVIWYLIRCEPFTSLHVQLQDGKFDKADRLFDSIEATWKSCTTNSSDGKELIPELFYLPECLTNDNNINFGSTQSGKVIDNVRLPPWANNDPYYFIYKHREALESEHVSRNLHHWIDLIFGYKQRPPFLPNSHPTAAVEACNVFYYLTYSGAVDLDNLYRHDKIRYEQTICQISEFGQTPSQLFTKPHIKRKPLREIDIVWQVASIVRGVDTLTTDDIPRPKQILGFKLPQQISKSPILFIYECSIIEKLITIDTNRIIGYHSWQNLPPDVPPHFKIKVDTNAWELSRGQVFGSIFNRITNYNSNNSNKERRIGVPFAPPLGLSKTKLSETNANIIGESKQIFKPWNIKKYEKLDKYNKDSKVSNFSERKTDLNDIKNKRYGMRAKPTADFISYTTIDYKNSNNNEEIRKRSQSEITIENIINSTNENRKRSQSSFDIDITQSNSRVSDEHLSSQLFAIIPELKLLLSVGHWDSTLRITSLDTGKLVQTLLLHNGVVTCVAVAKDFGQHFVATGSRDCTVMIWNSINGTGKDDPLSSEPSVLYGHDDAITSVAISPEHDIIVSGSQDGTLIVHTLRTCSYIRSIINGVPKSPISNSLESNSLPTPLRSSSNASLNSNTDIPIDELKGITKVSSITWVGISKESMIVSYVAEERLLCSYTINGHLLASKIVPDRLYAFTFSEDGLVLLTGGDSCLIALRWVRTLELAKDGPRKGFESLLDGCEEIYHENSKKVGIFNSPIRSLHLTKYERHLIVGLESGEVKVLAQESQYLRDRLLKKLVAIGFSV